MNTVKFNRVPQSILSCALPSAHKSTQAGKLKSRPKVAYLRVIALNSPKKRQQKTSNECMGCGAISGTIKATHSPQESPEKKNLSSKTIPNTRLVEHFHRMERESPVSHILKEGKVMTSSPNEHVSAILHMQHLLTILQSAKVLFCKENVYVHPSGTREDGIPGYLSLIELVCYDWLYGTHSSL